ncbi:MAG: hypothetical protein ACE5ID_04390, partial [Acidobacteriota bacterium]
MPAQSERNRGMEPGSRRSRDVREACGTCLLGAALFLALGPGAAQTAAASSEFYYRVNLTRNAVQVSARFPVQKSKDFAFLTTLHGRQVQDLRVEDRKGRRR